MATPISQKQRGVKRIKNKINSATTIDDLKDVLIDVANHIKRLEEFMNTEQ